MSLPEGGSEPYDGIFCASRDPRDVCVGDHVPG
jgi:hypothetical protein